MWHFGGILVHMGGTLGSCGALEEDLQSIEMLGR